MNARTSSRHLKPARRYIFDCQSLACVGFGVSGIGETSPTDGKFLVLSGEGGATMGTPQVLTLPSNIVKLNYVKYPTLPQTLTAMGVPTNNWWRTKGTVALLGS